MTIAATMWIRDGVLIDRMPINAVAFAYAFYQSLNQDSKNKIAMAPLVNFAFAKSGLSCSEKMHLFNAEVMDLLPNIEAASALYNSLSSQAGKSARYSEGAVETLKNLELVGSKNFITSAIEQEILDDWLRTAQGLEVVPYLTETLGRRHNFVKGPDHFQYVSDRVGGRQIYYIADAPLEIAQARKFADQCNLVIIGFASYIGSSRVEDAEQLLRTISGGVPSIDLSKLVLPDLSELESDLQRAGADLVLSDFRKLQAYFSKH